jgi:acyl-CoA thioester hydrolase
MVRNAPTDEPHIHETAFRVRFAETDAMGIAHHAMYLVYFEAGRVEFSRHAGASYAELEAEGYSLAVSEVNLRYAAPARFDQMITVRTWVEDIRSRSVTFAYQIVDSESRAILVTGTTRLICLDREGRVHRIPQGWYDAMHNMMSNPGL